MDINGTTTPESQIIKKINLTEEISNMSYSEMNNININETITNNLTFEINSISDELLKSIPELTETNLNETNKHKIIEDISFSNNITYSTQINDIINNKNDSNVNNPDTSQFNTPTEFIKENNQIINNFTTNNPNNNFNATNISNNLTNQNNTKNAHNKIIDNLDPRFILGMEIFLPIIVIIIVIIFILYCIKKKKNLLIQENINNEKNGIKFQNIVNSTPYNRVQNTSGFNVGLNPNNFSMSEIKVQNLKDEIHNIINNSSGGSNSSGKRKREKRKMGNNNINYSSQENNKGIQNEIQEEIKKYVIDEHINNS